MNRRLGFGMNCARGFTLLETMLALGILASGLVLISQTWGGSTQRLLKAKLNHEVASLLEKQTALLVNKYEKEDFASIPEEESGDFGKEFSSYKWTAETKEFAMPDLSGILMNNDGGADQTLLSMIDQMSEHFSKAVKELKVTLIYKSASGKELKWSVVTYLVHYDEPISVGAP